MEDFKTMGEMSEIEGGRSYKVLCEISTRVAQDLKKYEPSFAETQFILRKIESIMKNTKLTKDC